MTKMLVSFILNAATLIMLLSCGGEEPTSDKTGTADYLVDAVDSIALERTSEVRVFVGDSLWEYINGGAELYHVYNFVEVATAYYAQQGTEILVDIYQFDTPDHAFGLYSMLRAETSEPVTLGVEGFGSATNLVFVKGVYVLMFTGFEQTEEVATGISKTAPVFENLVVGTKEIPKAFAIFPSEGRVNRSQKLHGESFLGQSFLRDVYSQTHVIGADTVTLFVTEDSGGAKYIDWVDNADGGPMSDLPYDNGLGTKISSNYYGDIVAGLRGGKLVGVVGYKDAHREFITGWLESMPAASP